MKHSMTVALFRIYTAHQICIYWMQFDDFGGAVYPNRFAVSIFAFFSRRGVPLGR